MINSFIQNLPVNAATANLIRTSIIITSIIVIVLVTIVVSHIIRINKGDKNRNEFFNRDLATIARNTMENYNLAAQYAELDVELDEILEAKRAELRTLEAQYKSKNNKKGNRHN